MGFRRRIRLLKSKYQDFVNKKREIIKHKECLQDISSFLNPKGVHILYVFLPDVSKIQGLTDFELERHYNWSFDHNRYREEIEKLRLIYGKDVTPEYILSVFDGGIVVQGDKRKVLIDFESENQHIINGRRMTTGQPSVFNNTIYTHGACTWRGTGVEDSQTIASFLQQRINNDFPNSYRVVNSAIGRASTIFDDYEVIKEQNYKVGDIVIIGSFGLINSLPITFFNKLGIKTTETSTLFNRPHNYGEWFNDNVLHTNKNGNVVIANQIFESLQQQSFINPSNVVKQDDNNIEDSLLLKGERIYGDNPELLKFLDHIKQYKRGNSTSKNGCIVMNCNPFTLGHRFLIEYASSKVDFLYIFVVEENRSFFNFKERFELVKNNTSDIKNVVVLPSGNFIISAVTFPGYFYKDNLTETKIDCSNDINVFAQYIAPLLNITVRFAGEEPLDPITNQYNQGMKEILPKYGIQFVEIKRKKYNNDTEVISASKVRKLYQEGNFSELQKILPEATYQYLLKRDINL